MANILNLPFFTYLLNLASLSSLSSLDEPSFSASTVVDFNDKDNRKKPQFLFSSSLSSDSSSILYPSPFY